MNEQLLSAIDDLLDAAENFGLSEHPAVERVKAALNSHMAVPLTDEEIALMAFNDCPEDWNDLGAKAAWLEGYKMGAREALREVKRRGVKLEGGE